jgi:hypothetical protein
MTHDLQTDEVRRVRGDRVCSGEPSGRRGGWRDLVLIMAAMIRICRCSALRERGGGGGGGERER